VLMMLAWNSFLFLCWNVKSSLIVSLTDVLFPFKVWISPLNCISSLYICWLMWMLVMFHHSLRS